MRRLARGFLVVTLGLSLAGCGSSGEPIPGGDSDLPTLSEIRIESSNGDVLVVTHTARLTVSGFDQFGDPIAVGADVTWTVDNGKVVVDSDGAVEAIEAGIAVVTATAADLVAEFQITVEAQTLSRFVIEATNGTRLDLEETTELTTEGFDQLNAPMAVTDITWRADNANVEVDQNGLVTGKSVGESVVTGEAQGVESSISITVWDSSAPRTEIYVSDVGVNRNGPHQILAYDEDGQNGRVFISTNLARPQDIVFLEDQGIVLVSNLQANNITKYDANTGAFLGTFATGVNQPTRVEIGPDSLIYVLPWGGGPVKRYNQDGTFVDDFTDVSVNEAIGIAWDTAGNLYVSSFNGGNNGFVRMFDQTGADQGLFISTNLTGPTDIWFDDAGNLFVNDWSGNNVKQFDATGAFTGVFISGLAQPEGVDFLNGNILIGNSGNGSVKMYNAAGAFIRDIVTPGSAGLVTTNAVTVRRVNQ